MVVALGLLAAGCGGGDAGKLSKEEYVSKLNAICADFNAKQKEIGVPQSIPEVAEKGPEIIDEFDKALDKVKDLEPPDEIADQANRFIELTDQQRDLVQELIDAAKDNDAARLREIGSKIEPIDAEADQIATELGAPACAEN